jgi:gas vesicle protein
MVGTLERMRRLYGWLFGVVVGFAIAAFYAPALGTARDDALELKAARRRSAQAHRRDERDCPQSYLRRRLLGA